MTQPRTSSPGLASLALLALLAVACSGRRPPPTGGPCVTDADCSRGTYCALDAAGALVCSLPSDTPVMCGDGAFPRTGDACDPDDLEPGYVCRQLYCAIYCYPECTCDQETGRWECGDVCRDFFPPDGGRLDCGSPPRCRAWCEST